MLPTEEPRPLAEGKRTVYAYRLLIETSTGSIPNAAAKARMKDPVNDFYQGAGLVFLGTRSDLDRDLYTVEWGPCDFPAAAVTDESFTITTRVTNRSAEVWPASGPTRAGGGGWAAYRSAAPCAARRQGRGRAVGHRSGDTRQLPSGDRSGA